MPTSIEISSTYADFHPTAVALKCGGNAAKHVRQLVEVALECKESREEIVEIWNHSEAMDNVQCMRATLSTASKKVLGYGLTVKNGELVAAPVRAKKSSPESEFIAQCKEFAKGASAEDLEMALTIMGNISKMPKQA